MNIDNNSNQNNNKAGQQFINCQDTIFSKTKDLEYILIAGLTTTLFLCFCASVPIETQSALILGSTMTLLQYLIHTYVKRYYRAQQLGYQKQEVLLYRGDLNEIVFCFYNIGLKLESKIGEYYIFSTSYRIFANSTFIVREEGQFCKVQADTRLIVRLKEYIEFN